MPTLDPNSHPFTTLSRILRLVNGGALLHFSVYRYSLQQIRDDRRIFKIQSDDISEEWLTQALQRLAPEEELALNSVVKLGGNEFHIPMIDFAGIGPDHYSALTSVFGPNVAEEFDFFSSGRSFHAYGRTALLTHSDWIKFMGKLLLCNMRNMPMVVDQRWVGHRLIGGYSALRWSCNSSRHKTYPTLVARMEDLVGLTRADKLVRLGQN